MIQKFETVTLSAERFANASVKLLRDKNCTPMVKTSGRRDALGRGGLGDARASSRFNFVRLGSDGVSKGWGKEGEDQAHAGIFLGSQNGLRNAGETVLVFCIELVR